MKQDNNAHNEHDLDVSDIRNEGVSHELGDVNPTPVYKFLAWLGVLVIFTYFLVYGIILWNESRMEKVNSVVSHMPKTKSEQLPPEPRLQLAPGHTIHPLDEGIAYRDSVRNLLETYAYLDKQKGVVRIPIDRAKDLFLQKGVAVRMNPGMMVPAQMVPEFSSSGRTMVNRDQRVPGGTFTTTGGDPHTTEKPTE